MRGASAFKSVLNSNQLLTLESLQQQLIEMRKTQDSEKEEMKRRIDRLERTVGDFETHLKSVEYNNQLLENQVQTLQAKLQTVLKEVVPSSSIAHRMNVVEAVTKKIGK
jgi:predicted nuclease with TOPRIM domain